MSTQPAVLVVSYPSTTPSGSSTKFNMDYYTTTHMSLIAKHWTQHNMTSWTITSFSKETSLDGSTPPYCVQANVHFKDLASLQAALGSEGSKETGADVANFTDVQPAIWVSRLEKSG